MKILLPLILLIYVSARAQNGDCLKVGENLAIKIDSICFNGWNHSTKPTITIIDYGTLPTRGDTTNYPKIGSSLRVYRLNGQIIKLAYQGIKEDRNELKVEKEDIEIFFNQDQVVYVDYKLDTTTENKQVIDLRLNFCNEELSELNDLIKFKSIIEKINRLIDDARN